MEYLVKEHTGKAIQNAIDAAAAAGGGKVTLLPGDYLSGTIYLKSNIELHIPGGSRILGLADPELYDDFSLPEFDMVRPERSKKCLLACANGENISITGTGEINGQGPEFYDRNVPEGEFFAKPPHPRPRMLQLFRCKNVVLENITLKDSPGWTCWFIDCEDIRVSRIRIIGNQQMINNDGIDIDGCRRVSVQDSYFCTGDDCLVLRAMRKDPAIPVICESIIVSNCILNSRCQGIRIGCPSDDTIRNCLFSDIVFTGEGRGIVCSNPYVYLRKNCRGYLAVSDIVFRNFSIETKRTPIQIFCEGNIELRELRNLRFEHFRIKAKEPLQLEGNGATVLKDIVLNDFSGTIQSDIPLKISHVENLALNGIKITTLARKTRDDFQRTPSASWECDVL